MWYKGGKCTRGNSVKGEWCEGGEGIIMQREEMCTRGWGSVV